MADTLQDAMRVEGVETGEILALVFSDGETARTYPLLTVERMSRGKMSEKGSRFAFSPDSFAYLNQFSPGFVSDVLKSCSPGFASEHPDTYGICEVAIDGKAGTVGTVYVMRHDGRFARKLETCVSRFRLDDPETSRDSSAEVKVLRY